MYLIKRAMCIELTYAKTSWLHISSHNFIETILFVKWYNNFDNFQNIHSPIELQNVGNESMQWYRRTSPVIITIYLSAF